MYILFLFIAVITLLIDLHPKKKLRRNIKLTDKLNNKFSKFHYKKDSKNYRNLNIKIRNAGLNLSPETFQTIRFILPTAVIIFYILFEVINYLNLQINIEELKEAAKILNNETILNIHLNINIVTILFIGFITLILPNLILIFMIKIRSGIVKRESLVLQTYTIMLLKTSRPIKHILLSLYERANYFKPLLKAANEKFSADSKNALEELKNSSPQGDFVNICIALQQAMNSDRKFSVMYLENHRNLSREVNKQIRIRNQTRNQGIGILIMMIPLLINIAIVGYPWLMYTIRAIRFISI